MSFGGDDFFGGPLSLGQFGYMAEAEGQDDLVNTPDARFNAALNEMEYLADLPDDYDATEDINDILESHGIDPDRLTSYQIDQINRVITQLM